MFDLELAENKNILQLVNDTDTISNFIPDELNNYNQFSSATDISPELIPSEITTPREVDKLILSPPVGVDNLTYYLESDTEFRPNQDAIDPLTGIPSTSERTANQFNPTPQFDNDLINARNIGILNGNQFWQDFVGTSDFVDYYRFELNTTSDFNLFLSGLSADADVTLLQDNNNNGLADFGETIDFSDAAGNTSEEINLFNLDPGTYYVEVSQYSGDTNYDLTLSATPSVNVPPLNNDNDLTNASNIGVLNGNQFWQDFVGTSDSIDYYRFDLDTTSDFTLFLSGLSADADVELLQDSNNNGLVDFGETIDSSVAFGNTSEEINLFNLDPGTYYIEVSQYSGDTNYDLTLSTRPSINTLNSDLDLINASNIGVLNGEQFWQDFVGTSDSVDYYRFDLDTTSDFSLFLSGLSADADVTLLQDSNNNGLVDFGETIDSSIAAGNTSEEINLFNLDPGTYYVEVSQYSGDTNYDLTLSATPSLNSGGFSSIDGYGLVDANAAVAQTIGAPFFPEVVDVNNWDIEQINAPEVWNQGYSGQGIVVAVIDSGVDYNHFDLAPNIWINTDEIPNNGFDDDGNGYVDDIRGWDFFDNNNDPMDLSSHGTHIAGTIAAQQNSFGVTGVAPNAQIMPVRVGNDSFDHLDIASGIYYAVDNGADVINLSLGSNFSATIRDDAIRYAIERGVVVVMAAGNDGSSFPEYPAANADQWGIAVGATDILGRINDASNRAGSTPLDYVVAPGEDVYSTLPNNNFGSKSGTSMATPHVAGVAALILSANPSLTREQVEYIITTTANHNQVLDISSAG
ncbi:S8 family serine peptidase [Dapis sp. BLCC M126]|uniref:S8 family serine peptidase n=1 Tax=Dapis sp. BLCC M126 TaxID=3400189 RepID=UPI003CF2043D